MILFASFVNFCSGFRRPRTALLRFLLKMSFNRPRTKILFNNAQSKKGTEREKKIQDIYRQKLTSTGLRKKERERKEKANNNINNNNTIEMKKYKKKI